MPCCGSVSASGGSLRGSVSDPDYWVRIQLFRLNNDPIRIQGFNDQKLEKIHRWKDFYYLFLLKVAIYLSLGLHKERPSIRGSLQPSKENIQHFKTWNFFTFLFMWIFFALLDPDPDSKSRSTDLIESVSNPDLDPKHCLRVILEHWRVQFPNMGKSEW